MSPESWSSAASRAVAVARAVASLTSERNVTFLAASVTYYAFVSLLPAAVLALVVAATIGGERLAVAVIEASAGVLTETGQQVLVDALLGGSGRGSVTLISLPLTVWGALKVLRGLDIAFTQVYGVMETEGIADQLRDALVVAVSIGGAAVVMVVLGGVAAEIEVTALATFAGFVALPLLLTLAFLPMYYVFPGVEMSLREAVPGAVFAGVGWSLLQAGFQAYVDFQAARGGGQAALYGALGAVLLLVTFLYFGATLVLVGGVLNAVLSGHGRTGGSIGAADGGGTGADDVRDRQGKGTDARAK